MQLKGNAHPTSACTTKMHLLLWPRDGTRQRDSGAIQISVTYLNVYTMNYISTNFDQLLHIIGDGIVLQIRTFSSGCLHHLQSCLCNYGNAPIRLLKDTYVVTHFISCMCCSWSTTSIGRRNGIKKQYHH